MEQIEFLCQKVWKSDDGGAMFAQSPEGKMIWTRDQALWSNFKAGNNIKGYAEPPAEGKKAYKLLSVGEAPEVHAEPPSEVGKPAPQEIGMWWKELGEMLRAKDIDITKPAGKAMRTAYYAQMLSVLPIEIKNKEP